MSEMNSGAVAPSIPDDTRLIGQRSAENGGGPVPFNLAQLMAALGGSGGEISRTVVRPTEGFSGVPAAGKEKQGLWWTWWGPLSSSHVFDGFSGIQGGPNEIADHFHYKSTVTNANGPGAGTAGYRSQQIYSAAPDGTSTLILHGYSPEITSTALTNEHSIDTTGTTAGGAPGYVGTIKLRHTSNHGLTLNQVVLLEVTGPVAGIQAFIYSGIVTQAPTLVSGVYETLIQISKLDSNHWTFADRADTGTLSDSQRNFFNGRWTLKTVAGEINSANKVSMARDTSGPVEQLLVTWGTAHGLVQGQSVSVWVSGGLTGMTGFWGGFHSGRVEEVVSSTVVRIRVRNMRLIPNSYSYTGAVTSATSTWAIFSGTQDPNHEINPSTNNSCVYRDNFGRVTRWMGGGVDVTADGEWACGTAIAPEGVLRGRGSDLRFGNQSLTTMAGAKDQRHAVRSICNFSATAPLAVSPAIGAIGTTNGAGIGTGEFSVVIDAMLDFGGRVLGGLSDTAAYWLLRLNTNGSLVLETWDGTTITSTTVATGLSKYQGTRGVLTVQRLTADVRVYFNGTEVYRGTPASWNRSVSAAAVIRVGGAFLNPDRYNGSVYSAWAFAHSLTQRDMDFIGEHGRIPTALQWAPLTIAYTAPFGSGVDGWDASAFGVTLNPNVDSIGSRDDCLELTISATSAAHVISKNVLARAKRFRISLEVFRPAANTVATGILVQPFAQASSGVTVPIPADAWTTIVVDAEEAGVTGNTVALLLYMLNAAGATTYTGNGTDKVYIRNLQVQRMGAFMALEFNAGAGPQVADLSGNAFHAPLSTPMEHAVPERRFTFFARVSLTGNTQIAGLANMAKIPTNARIVSITANAAGSVTLSVGNANGGTQIVNAQALTSGIQDVALAGRFTSTGDLFVNLSSGVQVDLTIECLVTGA